MNDEGKSLLLADDSVQPTWRVPSPVRPTPPMYRSSPILATRKSCFTVAVAAGAVPTVELSSSITRTQSRGPVSVAGVQLTVATVTSRSPSRIASVSLEFDGIDDGRWATWLPGGDRVDEPGHPWELGRQVVQALEVKGVGLGRAEDGDVSQPVVGAGPEVVLDDDLQPAARRRDLDSDPGREPVPVRDAGIEVIDGREDAFLRGQTAEIQDIGPVQVDDVAGEERGGSRYAVRPRDHPEDVAGHPDLVGAGSRRREVRQFVREVDEADVPGSHGVGGAGHREVDVAVTETDAGIAGVAVPAHLGRHPAPVEAVVDHVWI